MLSWREIRKLIGRSGETLRFHDPWTGSAFHRQAGLPAPEKPLLERRLCINPDPIIRRPRHSPNVLGALQFDSAVSRLVWIDVHDLGFSAFVGERDVYQDFHSNAQYEGSQNQGTMEVDDERLAFARQRFAHPMSLDLNLQSDPSASSLFKRYSALRTCFNVSHRAPQSVTDLPVLKMTLEDYSRTTVACD